MSQLYLFEADGWRVKYRISFAEVQETRARAAVSAFLEVAPWGSRTVEVVDLRPEPLPTCKPLLIPDSEPSPRANRCYRNPAAPRPELGL